jgi:hypothetical protein
MFPKGVYLVGMLSIHLDAVPTSLFIKKKIYSLHFKMSVVLAKKNYFKMNVTFSLQCNNNFFLFNCTLQLIIYTLLPKYYFFFNEKQTNT